MKFVQSDEKFWSEYRTRLAELDRTMATRAAEHSRPQPTRGVRAVTRGRQKQTLRGKRAA